jgi:hypothetical protein
MDNPKSIWLGIALTAIYTVYSTSDRYTSLDAEHDRRQMSALLEQTVAQTESIKYLLEQNRNAKVDWQLYISRIDAYMKSTQDAHKTLEADHDKIVDRLPRLQILNQGG